MTSLSRLQKRARETILAVYAQLHSSQRRSVTFPAGSLSELYVCFHHIQEQTRRALLECEKTEEIHAICGRATRLAEDVLCAVRPSVLAEVVASTVTRYVDGLRASEFALSIVLGCAVADGLVFEVQETSSALHECTEALTQDADEPLDRAVSVSSV